MPELNSDQFKEHVQRSQQLSMPRGWRARIANRILDTMQTTHGFRDPDDLPDPELRHG